MSYGCKVQSSLKGQSSPYTPHPPLTCSDSYGALPKWGQSISARCSDVGHQRQSRAPSKHEPSLEVAYANHMQPFSSTSSRAKLPRQWLLPTLALLSARPWRPFQNSSVSLQSGSGSTPSVPLHMHMHMIVPYSCGFPARHALSNLWSPLFKVLLRRAMLFSMVLCSSITLFRVLLY